MCVGGVCVCVVVVVCVGVGVCVVVGCNDCESTAVTENYDPGHIRRDLFRNPTQPDVSLQCCQRAISTCQFADHRFRIVTEWVVDVILLQVGLKCFSMRMTFDLLDELLNAEIFCFFHNCM